MEIITTSDPEAIAKLIAEDIIQRLDGGKKVLWFLPGGSGITVAVLAAGVIKSRNHANLVVTLTDERFGPIGHKDSNWQQLIDAGLDLPQARKFPVLLGQDQEMTTTNFNNILKAELSAADYKVGLFGIGVDGHTAGILPGSVAVNSTDLVAGYHTGKFDRVSITPKVIVQLDKAFVYAQGREKWKVIEDLGKEIDIHIQPAQILKKVPSLIIFTDYK